MDSKKFFENVSNEQLVKKAQYYQQQEEFYNVMTQEEKERNEMMFIDVLREIKRRGIAK